ncbi:MAG: hypothetical protein C4532_00595 [Candidatus Abyssobacteria bacterium SURF_17]|jgi:hypothetical protein|uniref:Uncharacterized protein n=1 Tax=Candidatus Abyssobacteria bacterium SURF_17 TaxID=2093361 RepID=A0A419F9G9_9BACT|nr:MAG: hypothetical protein C4532_00595 [Candidatus Abyssubacteria bacterium SURF_17]
MNWHHLDAQMQSFAAHLTSEVGLAPEIAVKLATTIAADVRFLSPEQKTEIRRASPVPLEDRLVEPQAFQGWMEQANTVRNNPFVTRAQVLSQIYICFVYLPEACFRILAGACPSGSAAKKCAQFLSNNPVRAFRNAIAHANWIYRADFGAIIYWARKGSDPNEPLDRFEVEQDSLSFWQALSRCVAYVAYSNL